MSRFMTGPAVVAVCFTVLLTTTPAQATYPSKNGRIAFRLFFNKRQHRGTGGHHPSVHDAERADPRQGWTDQVHARRGVIEMRAKLLMTVAAGIGTILTPPSPEPTGSSSARSPGLRVLANQTISTSSC